MKFLLSHDLPHLVAFACAVPTLETLCSGAQDKVLQFWDVTRAELEAAVGNVRERESKLEQQGDRHVLELTVRHSRIWAREHIQCRS